ncbi:hypothetical protein L1987_66142 [Smallanthus sonchifolius]|uniref:Uncharacterized protein n=1 Tax=Smallanthus sonchifolius TaxID=185202 RepID=A0ACB9BWH6_9ASTR|nr:hypothetical protein L1987_66142 [Smallanthus sonchifolius]
MSMKHFAYAQKVKGTASDFSYLPEVCQRRIIHKDIKAANILLSEDFEPKVKDVMNKQEELPLCKEGDLILEQLVLQKQSNKKLDPQHVSMALKNRE